MAPPRPSSSALWILGALLLAGIGVAVLLPAYLSSRRESNENAAIEAMRKITAAQAQFRREDRDANRIEDFWTADVVGLADLGLLPREIGDADPSRPGAQPYRGYWFAAMDVDELGRPYRRDPKGRNVETFGLSAYPASPRQGRWIYYVNEYNVLYREPADRPIRRTWPQDTELKYAWSHVD